MKMVKVAVFVSFCVLVASEKAEEYIEKLGDSNPMPQLKKEENRSLIEGAVFYPLFQKKVQKKVEEEITDEPYTFGDMSINLDEVDNDVFISEGEMSLFNKIQQTIYWILKQLD